MTIVGEEVMALVGELMEVILHVKDMKAQASFYRDKLGLKLTYPKDSTDFAKEGWVTFETGACKLALHDGGRIRQGETPSHRIVFRVNDIHAARNQLLKKGVQVGDVRTPAPDVWVFEGRDPEGNVFSLESQ